MCDFEYDVFISHNSVDKAWVRALAARIEAETWNGRSLRVFFDEWDIQPGENIPRAIEEALAKSRNFILVLSPDASRSAWVSAERLYCQMLDPLNRYLRLIPLLLRGTEADIPPFVRALKYIDFREEHSNYQEALKSLFCALRNEKSSRSLQHSLEPAALGSHLASVLLRDSKNTCSICHTPNSVKLFPIRASTYPKLASGKDVIALCDLCHLRVQEENFTAEQLLTIKKAWLSVCASEEGHNNLDSQLEDNYKQACRLSLSLDPLDIKRAIVLCRMILHYQPFHADAQILVDKLLVIDRRLDELSSQHDIRYHIRGGESGDAARWAIIAFSLALAINITIITLRMLDLPSSQQRLGLIITILLLLGFFALFALFTSVRRYIIFYITWLAILLHETGHIYALYRLHPITNALGQRMPLKNYYEYLELEIGGRFISGGRREALAYYLRTGIFPGVCVNQSRIFREWYGRVTF